MTSQIKILEKTESICPECFKKNIIKKIDAQVIEQNNKIYIQKECPIHGKFKAIYFADSKIYYKWMKYKVDGDGIDNVKIKNVPDTEPKFYPKHLSQTLLANIIVTNRCNLRCKYCFMNAGASGYIYEPPIKLLKKMMKQVRDEKPVPCKALQITGGEPTIREDIIEIIKMGKSMGFTYIQLNSNGIRLSESVEFCKKVKNAGVNSVYMSFDGMSKQSNPWIEQNKKAVENLRKARLGVVLVPTVIKNSNLDEAGEILKYAIENIDIVRGVNFQPISFCGRAEYHSDEIRKAERVDYIDLFNVLEKSFNGKIDRNDFYPTPFVYPISKLVEKLTKQKQVEFTAHPGCGGATYLFADNGNIVPITKFIDVEKFMEFMGKQANATELFYKTKITAAFLKNISNFIIKDKIPKKLGLKKIFINAILKNDYKALTSFHHKALFVGTMWFQDVWNLNFDRLKRCVIHYSTPDGVVPFCSYNSLGYGDKIRKKYSMSIKEWEKKTNKKMKDDLWTNGPIS